MTTTTQRSILALITLSLPLAAVAAYEYSTFHEYGVSWPVEEQTLAAKDESLRAGSATVDLIVDDVNVATVTWTPTSEGVLNLTLTGPGGALAASSTSSDGRAVVEVPVNPIPQVGTIPAPSRLSAETITSFFTGTSGIGTWTATIRGAEGSETPIDVELVVATYSPSLVEV